MGTVANVSAGKPVATGWLYVAPKGTTPPTDATTALAGTFKDLGYVSEDGVTNTYSSDTEMIKDWGGQDVLAISSSKTDEFTFTLIESLNADVLKTIYGSANITTGTNTVSITANGIDNGEKVYVIQVALTNGAMKRIVIPAGVITEVGEITYKSDEAIGYEITLNALPDTSGNNHYEYIKLAS